METDMNNIEEQHKDYSNEQLINAISNTLVALDRQSHRLKELNKQMIEYQQSMQKAYLNYKSEQQEYAEHLAQIDNAQKALDNLHVSMDGYSKALTARVNKTAGI
jgi:DNA anti-recombination protein RmuC